MTVPFLKPEDIDQQAEVTRAQAYVAGVARAFPFDIESTVEFLFGYRINLAAKLPTGVLGELNSEQHLISVSEAIRHDGRRRFTVAHEVGHLVLHLPLLLARRSQPTLFEVEQLPYGDSRMEWQADAFAAAILMPTAAIVNMVGALSRAGGWIGPDLLVDTFGVSRQAAEVRLKSLDVLHVASQGNPLEM